MTISLSWLNDYLKTDLSHEELAEVLTSLGLEVEKIESRDSIMGGLAGIVAGKVLTCEKHPDADRLSVTTVEVGHERPSSIVCGANNIAAGQMVWVALPETTLYDSSGAPWTIKVSRIRGAVSEGMICAEDELGLGDNHDGIIVLPDAVQVGTKASDYYKVTSDTLFEIGLTPNRSDATSIIGVAEDLAAYFTAQQKKPVRVEWPQIPAINANGLVPYKVEVRNQIACPRYSGVLINNIQIGPSPDWMQKKLQSIGVKTINNIVDITNFVLHEMGQPLHAFDADKISRAEIIVETKGSGAEFLALDGQTYQVFHEDLLICDGDGKPMCIGGVYGGLHSGVTDSTTSIFLEAAHFNAGWIRRTSMRHNLRTEAAKRFEKGSDPNITLKALARACDLISQLAGGTIASGVVDIYPDPIQPARITLNYANLNAITGITFQPSEVMRLLTALNIEVVETFDHKLVVAVPTNKADVLREIDVIEEILRIYGFTNVPLPGKMQTVVAIESRHAPHRMRRLIGQYLASRGFLEAMNMTLTQPVYYKNADVDERDGWVTIHNTSNEGLNLLRPDMLIPMLETIKRNINRRQKDVRLFEFGKTYAQSQNAPVETEHLVLTFTGLQQPENWLEGKNRPVDFFFMKAELEQLLRRIGIVDFHTVSISDAEYSYGLEYKAGALFLGRGGAVSKQLLDNLDIDQEVFIVDLQLSNVLQAAIQTAVYYEELNRYPSVERDLAVVINKDVPFSKIKEVVLKTGGQWLTDLEVFDVYANADHLGENKKSVALRFTIENKESTLTDKDIDQWFVNVQKALVKEVGAEIRR